LDCLDVPLLLGYSWFFFQTLSNFNNFEIQIFWNLNNLQIWTILLNKFQIWFFCIWINSKIEQIWN
jgi:hypothetical protein